MARKPFNKDGIAKVQADKPIVYELKTAKGNLNYIGSAKKGRGHERLNEHLPGGLDPIPAKTVKVTQFSSIAKAKAAEKRAIKAKQPKCNIQHK